MASPGWIDNASAVGLLTFTRISPWYPASTTPAPSKWLLRPFGFRSATYPAGTPIVMPVERWQMNELQRKWIDWHRYPARHHQRVFGPDAFRVQFGPPPHWLMQQLRIARLHPEAVLPDRKHVDDAGLDIYASQSIFVAAHSFAIVPTGITMEVPAGYVALLKPKGRSNHLLGAGVVDAGYQGEILVKVSNPTAEALSIHPGDAIAQVLLIPIITPAVLEVSIEEIHQQSSQRGPSGGIVSQHKTSS